MVKLFFVGLTKVLDVGLGNHLGIMLMLPVIDNVEKEGLCHTINLDFIIAHIELLFLRNISLEHGREYSATVFLNRHILPLAWHKMDEVAKVTQYHVWHSLQEIRCTLFYLV